MPGTERRAPAQARSQSRMARALDTATELLLEAGPEKTSIPEIAKRSGVPRASIYQYFPDKYELFAHLAAQHMERVAGIAASVRAEAPDAPWRELVDAIVRAVSAYYNENRAASLLLLDGPFSSADRDAHRLKDAALGNVLREHAARNGALRTLPAEPDAAALAVGIAFACMKYGYLTDGRISDAICTEASRAVVGYLAAFEG
ncbi:TetR/AcrR family transcriptional regulator [Burkholderia sp. WAC0059]|uniref:TetR/AcrR family transcriptional regulator n=1 Tax=Burkholderia sp. WAC0059 TaxID=2066022 RepID=UPI0015E1543D|nr:TetR/AcrR family transcriptional regulator [Burkholderia sp. WAC0059]